MSTSSGPKPTHEPRAWKRTLIHEMGHSDGYGCYPELHDTGQVELPGRGIFSEWGKEINESPQSNDPVLHELGARSKDKTFDAIRNREKMHTSPPADLSVLSASLMTDSSGTPALSAEPCKNTKLSRMVQTPTANSSKPLPLVPRSNPKTKSYLSPSPCSIAKINQTPHHHKPEPHATPHNSNMQPALLLPKDLQPSPIESSSHKEPLNAQHHQPMQSRTPIPQSTYANLFDYGAYISRHGTPYMESAENAV